MDKLVEKFRVDYDDQLNDLVDRISYRLESFGITINELDSGDGYMEYEIIKIKDE